MILELEAVAIESSKKARVVCRVQLREGEREMFRHSKSVVLRDNGIENQKGEPMQLLSRVLGLTLISSMCAIAQSNVTTTNGGTPGTIPTFTGTSNIESSPIAVSGSNVGIGTTTPGAKAPGNL
jgi:hypothetical protein